MFQDILIRPHPPGQYTAQVVGIPEIRVEAASPEEAIGRIRELMCEWFKDAKMVRVNIPMDNRLYPSEDFPPKPKDPNDPLEREYLEELARMKKEDLERTLREYEQERPNSDPNDPMEREYWKALVARMRRDMPDMAGHAKDDPLFDEYLEEIARARREEDEREKKKEEACPNSSSTPTT